MQRVTYLVPGCPLPLARARVTEHGTYTPKRSRDYKQLVAYAALVSRPKDWKSQGRFRVTCAFRTKNNLADIDNLCKMQMDALQGVLFDNDRDVVYLSAHKISGSLSPCAEVTVEREDDK